MMNSNELMKDLNKVLKESGWLDKANEFYRNHPEYFSPSTYSGFISNLTMSVSYQLDTLSNIATTKPCIFISMGNSIDSFYREYNQYASGDIRSRTWFNSHIVTEVKYV